MRTENWQSNTPGLRLVGEGESGSASSPYGPLRAGLTTSQATNKEAQLSELHNSWEREAQILESKYLEVLDTLIIAIKHLVKVIDSLLPTDTTKE